MSPRNFLIYPTLALWIILTIACSPFGVGGIVGSGNVTTQERAVADFDEIELSFIGHLKLVEGDETALVIEGDDNVLALIETSVQGDRLIIKSKDNSLFGTISNVRSFKKLVYTVTTPDLEKLELSGAGDATTDGFKAEELTIELSGAGSLDFAQVEFDKLDIELSGAGSVELAGAAKELIVNINGLGSLDSGNLVSDSAKVQINGAGSAKVWARESLDAEINGAGSVSYYGNPSVEQSISGIGSIDGLGAKE